MANAGITLTTGADTKLSDVIQTIQKQSDYKFFYDDDIAGAKTRSVTLKDDNVNVALKKLLEGTQITYVIKDKVIYLRKVEKAHEAKKAEAAPRKITGVILDENGDPLIGASVRIKGTNIGVATDLDGRYTLQTTEANPVIECTYVGYAPKDAKATGVDTLDFNMTPDSQTLSEVVVTAFGIKR